MATRHVTHLIDDLDGSVIDDGSGKKITFSVDGHAYEIDLSDDNANTFYGILAPYVDAARRTHGEKNSTARRRGGDSDGLDLNAIRAWARENGHTVSDRGRVPHTIVEAYQQAH